MQVLNSKQAKQVKETLQTKKETSYEYINKVMFTGRLMNQPQVLRTANNKLLMKSAVSVWMQGGEKQNFQFFDIAYWCPDTVSQESFINSIAATDFKEGDSVIIEGAMTRRVYNNTTYLGINVHQLKKA